MSEEFLESLCAEVDYRLTLKKEINETEVLDILGKFNVADTDPRTEVLRSFVMDYTIMTEEYNKGRDAFGSNENEKVDYRRIGKNTFWFALLGSFFDPIPYSTAIVALTGAGLTLYDETHDQNMDMGAIGWKTLAGGLIGSLFDPSGSNICSYVGGGVGALVGLIKEMQKKGELSEEEAEKRLKFVSDALDTKYESGKAYLISTALSRKSQ